MLRTSYVAALLAMIVYVGSTQSATAQSILDLTYDRETGNLSAPPSVHALEIVSTHGLLTGVPTTSVADYYEHFLQVYDFNDTDPLDIGPVFDSSLTVEDLLGDLCVNAEHGPWPQGVGAYDIIRLNGQVLHDEPIECVRPPREFPPFSGERSAILQYDALTGELRLKSQSPISGLEIKSTAGRFTGELRPGMPQTFWDVTRPDKLFRHAFSGFVELDFGPIVETGLGNHEFVSDICVFGAWAEGGFVETVDYAYPDAGTVPVASCRNIRKPADAVVNLSYDAENGGVKIDTSEFDASSLPQGVLAAQKAVLMTTLDLRSKSGIFQSDAAENLDGEFDQRSSFRLLKQDRAGFNSLHLGAILPRGLSQEFLAEDVTLDLTFLTNNSVSQVAYVAVPEPAGLSVLWGLMSLCLFRRARP